MKNGILNPNRPSKLYAESVKAKNQHVSLIEKEKNAGGLLGGIGYVAGNLGLGALGIFEGVTDILAAGGDLIHGDTDMAQYRFLDNKTGRLSEDLNEWYNPSGIMKFAGDVGSGLGNSATLLIPYAGAPLFAAGVVGQGVSSAAAQTGKVGWNEALYGATSGALEFGLEALTGGVGGTAVKNIGKVFGKTAAKEGAEGLGKKMLKDTLKGAAGEFVEEAASTAIDPALLRISGVDKDAEAASFGDIMYSGFVGAVSGSLMTAPTSVAAYKTNEYRGKKLAADGKTSRVVSSARAVSSYLSGIQSEAEATAKDFADVNGIRQAKVRHALKGDVKRSAQFAEALRANLAAWDAMTLEDKASSKGNALLGEMQINTLYAQINGAIESEVAEIIASEKKLSEIAEYLRGKTDVEYSLDDLRADKDGILSEAVGMRLAERESANLSKVRKEGTARVGAFKEGKQTVKDIRRAMKGTQTGEASSQDAQTGLDGNLTAEQRNEQEWENKAADLAALRRALNGTKLSEDVKDTVISTYYPVKGMSAEDYATAFAIATIYGRNGVDKTHAYNDNVYVSRLPQKVADAAYSLGQKQKSGAETDNKKASADAEEGKKYSVDDVVDISDNEELSERISNSSKSKYDVIREYLIEKFGGRRFVLSDGRSAIMDKRDAKELSHKANKARTAQLGNLQALIENAKYDHSAHGVSHPKFSDFHYYTVSALYKGEVFDLWLNVGTAKNDGENHIYAITKNEEAPTNYGVSRPVGNAIQNASSDNSISQPTQKVNTSDEKSSRRSSREGKVIRADGVNMQKLNDRQYAAYKAAEIMARALGADIVIHAELGQTKNGKPINGYFDEATNTLHVNINAMRDGEHIALYTLSHEVTHYIKAWSGEKYKALEEFVFEQLKSGEGVGGDHLQANAPSPTVEDLIDSKVEALRAAGLVPKGATESEIKELAREEIVCDGMELVLTDGEVLRKLAARDATLWERIKNKILDILDKIWELYSSLGGASKTAKVLSDTMDSLDGIERLFTEAVTEAGDARRSGNDADLTGINAEKTQVSTIRYSLMNDSTLADNVDRVMRMTDEEARANKEAGNFISIMKNTPGVITENVENAENLEIIMRFDSFYLATRHDGALEGHYHNYGEIMKKLPEILSDPEAVVRMDSGRLNLLTTVQTAKGKYSVVSIELNTVKDVNSKFTKYNMVMSVIPAKDNYMRNNLTNHGVKVEYQKEGLSQVNHQLHEWLAIVNDKSSKHSISQDSEIVNKKFSTDDSDGEIPDVGENEGADAGERSAREILSGKLSELVQSQEEYDLIKKYRDGISRAESAERKINDLKARRGEIFRQLSELRAKKQEEGWQPWVNEEIKALQSELDAIATEIAKQEKILDSEDGKLLRMEAMKPLADVVRRKRREGMRDEKVAEEKRQARKTLRRTAARIYRHLLHPTKTYHTPQPMVAATARALSALNLDTDILEQLQQKYTKITELEKAAVRDEAAIEKAWNDYKRTEQKQISQREQMELLHRMYTELQNDQEGKSYYETLVAERLKEYIETVGDTSITNMSSEQLKAANEFYSLMLSQITNANKLFVEERKSTVEEYGEASMREVEGTKVPKIFRVKKNENPKLAAFRKYMWNALKPVYAFDVIGSPTLSRLFDNLRRGESVAARDIEEAKAYFKRAADKYGYYDWDMEGLHEITFSNGKTAELTLGELMSLFAYSKRKQADSHLRAGGFIFEKSATKVVQVATVAGKTIEREVRRNDAQQYTVDESTMAQIGKALSDSQKTFIDETVHYLSDTMAQKGNSVSRKLYGIDLFREAWYFPLMSHKDYLDSQTGKTGDPKVKNKGMTKETVPDAKNPIVLMDFTKVWTKHVNDMAAYHGLVLPMEDLNRVLDYRRGMGMDEVSSEKVVIQADGELAEKLKNSTKSKYTVIKDYLVEKFYGREFTLSDGKKAVMDKRDAQELSHLADDVKTVELSNLERIIEKAKFDNEATNVTHNKFNAFYYYAVTVEFEGQAYDILLNVGRSKFDGKNHIYDITKNDNRKRTAGQATPGLSRPEGNAIRNGSFNNSIPQNSQKVNPDSQKNSQTGGFSSLKALISEQYGDSAVEYIEQLLRDLNGGIRQDGATDMMDKGISLFKKAAVMGSLSVVVQQPSAIVRAFAIIDPKHFKGLKIKDSAATYEEIKKYAPVAIIKEMGGFDTGVGQATGDYITEREYNGVKDKLKALKDDKNYRSNAMGYLAQKADELTWIQIWEACKREQAEKHGLDVSSSELLALAGERFGEVITRTQVYDSTLSRSAYMRSKDSGAKMLTAFMAEPTTAINMLVNGFIQFERGSDGKVLRRTVGAVIGAVIFNAILSSVIYAMRDDDEDQTYVEKYVESLSGEVLDSLNPVTMLPFVKDIYSIAQGYDVERTDMAVIADLWQSIEAIPKENKPWYDKTLDVAANVGSLFGLPTRNILRDTRGIIGTVGSMASGETTTAAGIGYSAASGAIPAIPVAGPFISLFADIDFSNGQQLYNAIIGGDKAHYNRVLKRFDSETKLNNALRTALRDSDERIREAAQARVDGDIATYSKLVREVMAEGFFDERTVKAAVNAEYNDIMKDIENGAEDNKDEEVKSAESVYTSAMLNSELDAGDFKEAKLIIDDLVAAKVSEGKTEAQARSALRSSVTSYWKKKYLAAKESKNSAETARIRSLLTRSGLYGGSYDVIKLTEKWLETK